MMIETTDTMDEERQKEICECEDPTCKYYPLLHFERCPRCNSKAFHNYDIARNKANGLIP